MSIEGPEEVFLYEKSMKKNLIENENVNIEYLGVRLKASIWIIMILFLMLLVLLLIYALHFKKKVIN